MDYLGLGALALLTAATLAPMLAGLREAMRVKNRQAVQDAADAKLAERILEFDDVTEYARGVLARAYADGLFPDRRR